VIVSYLPGRQEQEGNTMNQDHGSVEQFLQRFAESWNSNDGSYLGELFAANGSLVNPFGQRADGRQDVAAMYCEYFTGMLQGSTTTAATKEVRLIGQDHAFIDAEQTIFGPDGDVLLVVRLAALLQRDGESWQFVDSRPYTLASLS
jgi:uncharacterized protein (TIGR02246 family)